MGSEDKSDSLQTNTGKRWTLEEHNLLLTLEEAGETWQDISERLARTPQACQHQYNQRLEVFQSSKGSLQTKLEKLWTEKEDKLLLALKEAGGTWQEISEILGRTPGACRGRYGKRLEVSEAESFQGSSQLENERGKWTEEEEKLLFQLKASDKTWPEIAKRLPGRTDIDCQRRYEESLDVYEIETERSQGRPQAKLIKLKPWTEEEDKLLLTLKEAGGTWQEISESLGRTPCACRTRYVKRLAVSETDKSQDSLKLRNEGGKWTEEEGKLLLALRKAGGTWQDISESLGRTPCACRSRYIKRLAVSETDKSQDSLKLRNEGGKWTEEEDKLLLALREAGGTWQDISESLGRTPGACRGRYGKRLEVSEAERSQDSLQWRNGKKKWTAEEEKLLFQLKVSDKTWQEISDHLPGRTVTGCLNHYHDVLHRGWGHEEENKLARLYESRKAEMWDKIAKRLAIPWREAEALHWQIKSRKAKPAERAGDKSVSTVCADLPSPRVHDAEIQANEQQQGQSQQDNKEKTWSREELEFLMASLKSNMTWEEVSKCLPGRTADSCRIYCAYLRKKGSECSREPQSELHRLYKRFKPEMWAKIGQELKLPWEEAEEMHWRLGAEGMAKRAGAANLTLVPRDPVQTTDEPFANNSSAAMSEDELMACIAELIDETVSQPSNDLESSNDQHES
ncbi:hypothetical protein E4U58_001850 [Claviceps cyperi]|nr:hypothetical protein E4U58_001850 [Claviceps cyperi]